MKQPINAMKQNKKYFFLMIFLDFLFLLAVINVMYVFFLPATESVLQMSDIIQQEFTSMTNVVDFDARLAANTEFMGLYHSLLESLVQFFLYCFVAWLLFKSLVWYFSHKSFHKKIPFFNYVFKFILLSLFWFVVILLALFLAVLASRQSFVSMFHGGSVVFWFLLVIILYFSQISYSLIPSTKTFINTFVFGIKRIKKTGVAFAVNVVLTVTAFAVMIYCAKYSVTLGFLVLFFLALPTLVFCRFNMIVASWKGK
ncbi:hypothetical protein KY329_01880 [Candidatus Woesearchaeota archaeon]|nr:hypothetical protein [Candidatus Woesearchaeota archaeon]